MIGVLYPYSVITSTGVLLINEEMNQGLFSTAPDILAACRRQFEETKGKAKPFLKTFWEYEQMIEYLGDDWQGSGRGYQYFSTPCLGTYLSKEMVKHYSPVGLQKQSLRYYNGLKKELSHISFCSKGGIWEFARTGAVPDYLHGLASPLEQKDRKAVLETMLNHSQDKGGIYLMDENEQAVSDEFVVSFSEDRYILVYRKGCPGQRIHLFQEQNLLDAFADYFQALETSQHLRPRSELEQVLREAIACCS